MTRSLGLTAYRAVTRRGAAAEYTPKSSRPEGELMWIHAADPENLLALQDIALRLQHARPGLSALLTLSEKCSTKNLVAHPDLIVEMAPSEHPAETEAFVAHWKPDICLWSWGGLRPNLIRDAFAQGCIMTLVDADSAGFDGRRDRWVPDVIRALLAQFSALTARNDPAARRLTQLGARSDRIEILPPLLAGGQALPCVESDLEDMSTALAGRPVWLACNLHHDEIDTVLSAHRQALRLSHRLLLILHTSDPADTSKAIHSADKASLLQQIWDIDGPPDESHQVLQVSDQSELGLFYRVAPISFIGNSLTGGAGGFDPMDAAALGSAVLYGPKVRRFLPSYTRLVAAGAARIVNDTSALGTAISRLIAPDQAAAMAHAGWDVISEGAEATDRLIDQTQDLLDRKQGATT